MSIDDSFRASADAQCEISEDCLKYVCHIDEVWKRERWFYVGRAIEK
jgi:hypothetical protein